MHDHLSHLIRRHLLRGLAAVGAATAGLGASRSIHAAEKAKNSRKTKGRIKQSIVFWCFNIAGEKWDLDRTCRVARDLGCLSVELAPLEQWGILKKHGLVCALAPNGMSGAPFMRGFNNPRYHEEVITRT